MKTIRRYQKPHLCKHTLAVHYEFVRVIETCPNENKWGHGKDLVDKKTCRECKAFQPY